MSTRGFPITQQRRDARRKQAEERQAEYDKLTTSQKLDRLPPTGSNKQRARLTAELTKTHTTVVAEAAKQQSQEAVVQEKNRKSNKKGN